MTEIDVRKVAEAEAAVEINYWPAELRAKHAFAIFADGAQWAVERLPSRDEIAAVFTARREPEYQIAEQEDFDDADAVLDLIRERYEGES